jgi:hypothetical protein
MDPERFAYTSLGYARLMVLMVSALHFLRCLSRSSQKNIGNRCFGYSTGTESLAQGIHSILWKTRDSRGLMALKLAGRRRRKASSHPGT